MDLISLGNEVLPMSHAEAVNLGRTAEWWKSLAEKLGGYLEAADKLCQHRSCTLPDSSRGGCGVDLLVLTGIVHGTAKLKEKEPHYA